MTQLGRIKVNYSNFRGEPGVNVLHFSAGSLGSWGMQAADSAAEAIWETFDAIKDRMIPTMTFTIPGGVEVIEEVTGELVDIIVPDYEFVPIVVPSGDGSTPHQCMAVASFGTDVFNYGRRLKGRAYIGPIAGNLFTNTGLLTTETQGIIQEGWDGMVDWPGARLCVYSRPKPAVEGHAARDGYYGDVKVVTVSTTVGTLRSRNT